MTDTVDTLITALLVREGGYVNNSVDRGGPTKYGITIGTLQQWRRQVVSIGDVQNLTEDEARLIYKTNYFTAGGFEHVTDPGLQAFLFDFAVNSGVGTASKALQKALGVSADGAIGPITLAALAANNNAKALFYQVKCERYELLLRYVGSDAEEAIFAAGWSNRLDQFEEK